MGEPLGLFDLLAAFVAGAVLAGLVAARLLHQRLDLARRSQIYMFDRGWEKARDFYRPPPLDMPDAYESASAHGGTLPWPPPGVSRNRAGRNRAGEAC